MTIGIGTRTQGHALAVTFSRNANKSVADRVQDTTPAANRIQQQAVTNRVEAVLSEVSRLNIAA